MDTGNDGAVSHDPLDKREVTTELVIDLYEGYVWLVVHNFDMNDVHVAMEMQ